MKEKVQAAARQRAEWLELHGEELHEIYFTRLGMVLEDENILQGLPMHQEALNNARNEAKAFMASKGITKFAAQGIILSEMLRQHKLDGGI